MINPMLQAMRRVTDQLPNAFLHHMEGTGQSGLLCVRNSKTLWLRKGELYVFFPRGERSGGYWDRWNNVMQIMQLPIVHRDSWPDEVKEEVITHHAILTPWGEKIISIENFIVSRHITELLSPETSS